MIAKHRFLTCLAAPLLGAVGLAAGPAAAHDADVAAAATTGVVTGTIADAGRVLPLAGGRIVVQGSQGLARYLADGTIDPSFGDGGRVLLDGQLPGGGQPRRFGVGSTVVLEGNRLLVAGSANGAAGLFVLDEHGDVDTRFGQGGFAPTPGLDGVLTLVARPGGDVLAFDTGSLGTPGTGPMHVFRVDPAAGMNGAPPLDPTPLADLRAAVPDGSGVSDVEVQRGGGIVAMVRRVQGSSSAGCTLVGLTSGGAVDAGFGTGGAVVVAAVPDDCSMALAADDGVVVAVDSHATATTSVVHRYDAHGHAAGSQTLTSGEAQAVAALGDGRIVLAMQSGAQHDHLRLLALGPGAQQDEAFDDALTLPPANGGTIVATGLVVLPSGGVMLSGTIGGASSFRATVALPVGLGPEPGIAATDRFVPLPPARVLDTRIGLGAPGGPLPDDGTIDLTVAGAGGVPASGAAAVVLNLTAVDATGPGYVTAWPTGAARPTASNVNVDHAGQTAPNLVIVRVGAGGRVSLYTQRSLHLVADVAGWFEPAATARAGRFVALPAPVRVLDTRSGIGVPAAKPGPEATITLPIAGRGGVPAAGAAAVVLNVTGTEATAAGYVTAWPSQAPRPVASNLNLEGPGATRANLVVVPLGVDGAVQLVTQSGAHLVADVAGWFTDTSAPQAASGLFVPVDPRRQLDTRLAFAPTAAGSTRRLFSAGDPVVPPVSAAAVVVNLTATDVTAPGYVTAFPAGQERPTTSSLNVGGAGATVANLAVVGLGGRAVDLYSQEATQLIVDLSGWFTD